MTVPVFLLFIFGFICIQNLVEVRRAMDFGIEKALRYAVVNGGGTTTAISDAYFAAAGKISGAVGTSNAHSTIAVSAAPATGSTLTLTATYVWTPPVNFSLTATPVFSGMTFTSTSTVLVVN